MFQCTILIFWYDDSTYQSAHPHLIVLGRLGRVTHSVTDHTLWGGLHPRTRPTRAAHMRARVARGASEPTANIACRAYSCTARRRGSPTKATEWRQASRAFREPRSAAHDCRGPVPPQSRNMSRAKHGSAAARQRTPSDFRTAATVPCSGRRPVAPDGRRPRAHCACPARWRQHRVPARRL